MDDLMRCGNAGVGCVLRSLVVSSKLAAQLPTQLAGFAAHGRLELVVRTPVIVRDLPAGSRLASQRAGAYYSESYEVPLKRSDLKMHEIYLAILGHLPWWARALIVVRNHLVVLFGLHAEPSASVWKPAIKEGYAPGEKILRFNLYSLDDHEIVTGRDDKHLDFRVSVMQVTEQGGPKVVVSTLIFVHNLFGKAYLLFVLPLHKLGMRRLLAQAVAHGRI